MNNEIKKRLPLQCPACDAPLKVGRMFCGQCDTDKEQRFVIDFIKSSGSLKDMAKSMGVSYPTVRNILDELIDKLIKIE